MRGCSRTLSPLSSLTQALSPKLQGINENAVIRMIEKESPKIP